MNKIVSNPNRMAKFSRIGLNTNTLSEQYINNMRSKVKIRLTKNERQNCMINTDALLTKYERGGYESKRGMKVQETECEMFIRAKVSKELIVSLNYLSRLKELEFTNEQILDALKTLIVERKLINKDDKNLYWINVR